ncbi:MAG: AMP-binding protein [Burkholderiaceae bacterium]
MVARAMVMMAEWSIAPTDGSIAWSPLFHMAAADPALAALCQGAPVYLIDGFEPEALVEALATIDTGWFVLMPGMILRMIEALQASRKPVRRIAAAGCMANLVPVDQLVAVTSLLRAPFLNSFGSTETGIAPASGAMIAPGERPTHFRKRQTVFCEARIVDDDGRELADGEVGGICLRGPTLFSGYWNAPEANTRAFRDGWYQMGDDFARHADGTLDFVDRRKYLISPAREHLSGRDRAPFACERPHRRSGRGAPAR